MLFSQEQMEKWRIWYTLQMENRGVILSEMRQSVAHNPFLPPYLLYIYIYIYENDFFSVSDTGILGKINSEFSQQESNLRPSDN